MTVLREPHTPDLIDSISTPASPIEYIGNKRQIADTLALYIESLINQKTSVIDLFSGTGSVSAALKRRGFLVRANDHLTSCMHLTRAQLKNSGAPVFPAFHTPYTDNSTIDYYSFLQYLNEITPIYGGFFYRTYSPASLSYGEPERRYFTEENAAKIDAIRQELAKHSDALTEAQYSLLLSDLFRAANAVSNVAGTYGCFLKSWKPRALQPLQLRPSTFSPGPSLGHDVDCQDAERYLENNSAPVIYADPPYTKRQYAAYYHIVETLSQNDNPSVTGKTGLRDWRHLASDFCYKKHAPAALKRLLDRADCKHFILSYNADGQIPHDEILDILRTYGSTTFKEVPQRRYKSSSLAHKGPSVLERIYHLKLP